MKKILIAVHIIILCFYSINAMGYEYTDSLEKRNDYNKNYNKYTIHFGFETSTYLYFGINYRLTDDFLIEFDYCPKILGSVLWYSPYITYNIALNWKYNKKSMDLIRFNLPYIITSDVSNKFSPSISYVRSMFFVKSSHLKLIVGISSKFLDHIDNGLEYDEFSVNLGVQACVGLGK
jgi:hypothetical protein